MGSELKDVKAQISLKEHHNKKFRTELQEKEKLIKVLELQKNNLCKSLLSVTQQIKDFNENGSIKTVYEIFLNKVITLHQRLSFANNRLLVVQDLFKRQTVRSSNFLKKKTSNKNVSHYNENLKLEVVKLTDQQNLLRKKMVKDHE